MHDCFGEQRLLITVSRAIASHRVSCTATLNGEHSTSLTVDNFFGVTTDSTFLRRGDIGHLFGADNSVRSAVDTERLRVDTANEPFATVVVDSSFIGVLQR